MPWVAEMVTDHDQLAHHPRKTRQLQRRCKPGPDVSVPIIIGVRGAACLRFCVQRKGRRTKSVERERARERASEK